MGIEKKVSSLRKYKCVERLLDAIAFYKVGQGYYKISRRMKGEYISDNPFWNGAKEYFSNPEIKSIIKDNIKFLEDEKSVIQYKGIIKARQTRRFADVPTASLKKLPCQYFDTEIIPITDNYVFVDGGAWVGDSIYWFKKKLGGQKIISFEPGDRQFARLCERYGKDEKIILKKAGLWSSSGKLMFENSEAGGDARIVADGNSRDCVGIPVVSIDELEECRDASFIKMDIEGSEQEALKGAEETIRRNHPILAICLYHSNEDMVHIPKWLHDHFPEYKFYFRHYSFDLTESVFYAVLI
ncbi:MAG: FkbM family methyltransferase [Lachnospiraceae bacterium]|nr:FkbM family methyltransferase [Lachnospiraceae bacterium]